MERTGEISGSAEEYLSDKYSAVSGLSMVSLNVIYRRVARTGGFWSEKGVRLSIPKGLWNAFFVQIGFNGFLALLPGRICFVPGVEVMHYYPVQFIFQVGFNLMARVCFSHQEKHDNLLEYVLRDLYVFSHECFPLSFCCIIDLVFDLFTIAGFIP